MKRSFTVFVFCLILFLSGIETFSQGSTDAEPRLIPTPTPGIIVAVKKNNRDKSADKIISRDIRQQAYAKLLEGQRFLWKIKRARSEMMQESTHERLARSALLAFQKAVELNPGLAEGYTALAELSLNASVGNMDEALMFAKIASKLDSNNFGAHFHLALVNTLKSGLGKGKLIQPYADEAIKEWKEIGRLDPRNAEAWAFLSAFYKKTGQKEKRIESLKKWRSSAVPLHRSFYANVMGVDGDLSPERAATKLGAALVEDGRTKEALGVLTRAVADSPANNKAIDLLGQAINGVDGRSLSPAIEALRQAVFANPGNQSLIHLLAETIAKTGEIEGAVRVLRDALSKPGKNKYSASRYQMAIGDIFAGSNRTDAAIAAYRKALAIRGIKDKTSSAFDDKDFAIRVINKMVKALRKANRGAEAEKLLRDSRP